MVVLWGVCLYNWLANVNISAYINKSNLTSNLTSVTLEMRLRSNLPIYAGRAWSYCGGLVIIGIRRGLNNKGQLFSCFGHCAPPPPRTDIAIHRGSLAGPKKNSLFTVCFLAKLFFRKKISHKENWE